MGEKIRRSQRNFHFETIQLHAGQERPDPATGARAVPIYQTSSFVFDNCAHAEARFNLSDAGNIYGRLTNPTQDVFEQRMAALEGGVAALATASGAAALAYTFENLTRAGDHLVAAQNIYGGTYNFLAHTLAEYGVTTTFVDPSDLKAVEQAIRENTKVVFIETLGNPNSDVSDIRAIADIAHRSGIPLVIDNTFGTPYLIRPIEHGADIVVHSATKFIGGHGTTLGGVRKISRAHGTQRQLPRNPLCPGRGARGLCHQNPGDSAAGYGRCAVSDERVSSASGAGDPVPARGTPCGERPEGGGISERPPGGGGGASPGSERRPGSAEALPGVFSGGRRFHLHL